MMSLPRNFPRTSAGYIDTRGPKLAIPQFIPQFCGIAEHSKIPCKIRPSRHFSRQNGERKRPIAELVDTARRETAFQPTEGKPQTVPEGQDKLDVIEAEARETDKALRQILKKIGV